MQQGYIPNQQSRQRRTQQQGYNPGEQPVQSGAQQERWPQEPNAYSGNQQGYGAAPQPMQGYGQLQPPMQPDTRQIYTPTAPSMRCSNCGSSNISVQVVQTGAKTRAKGTGCLWSMGRWILILCTMGLWLLIGKRKGTGKTKMINEKQAICQSCGNSWTIQ